MTQLDTDNVQEMIQIIMSHEANCPIRGKNKSDVLLRSAWNMGFMDGVALYITSWINSFCKPGQMYLPEEIMQEIIMPLTMTDDRAMVAEKIRLMVTKTWLN